MTTKSIVTTKVATEPVLGTNMHVCGVTVKGRLNMFEWRALLSDLTKEMKMTPAHRPAVWNYPVAGQGGNGMTMVQPITESFLALDTWSDHDGAYIFICSCREFDRMALLPIFTNYGLLVGQEFYKKMSLIDG